MVAKAKSEEDKSTEKLIFILKIPSIQAYNDKENYNAYLSADKSLSINVLNKS